MTKTSDPNLAPLNQLAGSWTTEATHPEMPGVVVHGTATFEWLEGERFLVHRARTDHPDFPNSIAIIGHTDHDRIDDSAGALRTESAKPALRMHYFDSRGVFRVYETEIDAASWRVWRNAPEFSQRFNGTLDGDTIVGRWQLCRDDVNWTDDLKITYRRSN